MGERNLSILINIIGASGVGKSTTAGKLFTKLKDMYLNTEMVREVVKTWCYTGQKVTKYDQYYLFGAEIYQQSQLFNSVDFIISDSSPLLAAFYNYYYNKGDSSLSSACHEFYRKVAEDNIRVLNFFLTRKKKYIARGRYQSESESDQLSRQLQNWLDNEGYEYTLLDCPDKDRVDVIINRLREVTGDFNGMVMV